MDKLTMYGTGWCSCVVVVFMHGENSIQNYQREGSNAMYQAIKKDKSQ